MTTQQIKLMHEAADECMSPEQRDLFDLLGNRDTDVYARLFRCVVKRATTDLAELTSILASEIECSVFEQHVIPALEIAKNVIAEGVQQDKVHARMYRWMRDRDGIPLEWLKAENPEEADAALLAEIERIDRAASSAANREVSHE